MSVFPEVDSELIERLDRPAPRYTSYPTVPEWKTPFDPTLLETHLDLAAGRDEPLSGYWHIPFCEERCTFCGCNVVIAKDRERADRYLEHVFLEMEMSGRLLGRRRGLAQVHFGGGTPSFLTEAQLERLFAEITDRFTIASDAEVAVEIDPCVTSTSKLEVLAGLGFNRLSMGVQDFDPGVQAIIHRRQTAEETRVLLDHARSLGFQGVNFDLIYGLPGQEPSSWARTLELVVAMRPDRLAVYSFAFVPEARPHQKRLALAGIPMGPAKLELFRQAYETFTGAGYHHIGMDHFALPEDELSKAQARRALNRNFQGYTVKAASDVVAFGSSAISDVAGLYTQNTLALPRYYASLEEGRFPVERGIVRSEDDERRRAVINALMCNMWVDLDDHGGSAYFGAEIEALSSLSDLGLVEQAGSQINVTPLGRVFVRNVSTVFDAYAQKGPGRVFSRTI